MHSFNYLSFIQRLFHPFIHLFIHHSSIGGGAGGGPTPPASVAPTTPAVTTVPVPSVPDIASDAEFGARHKKHQQGPKKFFPQGSVEEAVLKRSSVHGPRSVDVL